MRTMATSALALMAGLTASAMAQEAAPPVDAADEEVVVTVQLRKQKLLEVPMAVTAITGSTLERFGITKFDELSLIVPGFEVQEQSANNTGFVIRGITSDSGSAQSEPRIAVFQDGVSTSRNRGTYMELYDLERIEVARGPQATLFGRGALIGAVNVIQNKADPDAFSGSGALGVGDRGFFRAEGVINVPIVEGKVAIRAAATHRQREGFVDNLSGGDALGGVNVDAWRVATTLQPTDKIRFDLIFNQHVDRNSGTAFKSGTYAPVGGTLSPFTPAALNLSAAGFEGGREIGLNRRVQSATLLGSWDFDNGLTLTSVTGLRHFNALELFDADGSAMPLIIAAEDAKGDQVSQEFRLAFDTGGSVTGFAGVSYFEEDGTQRSATQYDERYALAFATGLITGPATPSLAQVQAIGTGFLTSLTGSPAAAAALYAQLDPLHGEYSINRGETTSWDVFGDVTWKVTDRFELNGGVRYTRDDKTSTLAAANTRTPSALGGLLVAQSLGQQAAAAASAGNIPLALALQAQANGIITAIANPAIPDPPVGLFTQPQALLSKNDTFDGFTWRLTARYQASDNVSLWASYARGRTPEVIAISPGNLPGSSAAIETLPAETVDSYEIGARAAGLLDGTLDAEGSFYYYDYNDFQTTQFVGGSIRTLNAGAATAYGFESAVQWRASDELTLFGTYGYNHARFETGAREGNHFRLSPDHTVSAGFTFEVPIAGFGIIALTPTYSWQSEVFFDDNNDRLDLQPAVLPGLRDRAVDEFQKAYGLFNVRLSYETEDGGWTVTGFVNNIADQEYLLDAGNVGDSFTIPTFIRGPGRTAGVEIAAKF
ncbi:Vitamin B12 transporter BtuB [Alphaproteobacteria bacterium SO-S41]|nr:Vitamin B12 transporter BtuB [Alphaproteobacteria bacterium SO-S41]